MVETESKALAKVGGFKRLKLWAKALKAEVMALYLALKHPRTPFIAKIYCGLVVGYALSPIDLIPDFIPILGYLDDVILLPLGIALALKVIPPDVMQECRDKVRSAPPGAKPRIWTGAVIIAGIWLSILGLVAVRILS